MDEYLKDHLVVKFIIIFLVGIILFVCMYLIFRSYKMKDLKGIQENNLKRMAYWRSIVGMCIAIVVIIFSFYMLFEDLAEYEKADRNKIQRVEVRE